MRRAFERLSIAALLLGACACATVTTKTSDTLLAENVPMPLSNEVPLRALIEGRVAVVDLWASWCVACRESLATLVRLDETYREKGLIVAGVDVGEPPEVARRFAQDAGVTYPLYADPQFEFADGVGARELPSLLVFDRNGRIVARARALDRELLGVIRDLLER